MTARDDARIAKLPQRFTLDAGLQGVREITSWQIQTIGKTKFIHCKTDPNPDWPHLGPWSLSMNVDWFLTEFGKALGL